MTLEEARRHLSVDANADEKTVRRAYAKLAKTYRPDTHPEEFSTIRTAYDVLLSLLQDDLYVDPSLPLAPSIQEADSHDAPLPPRRAVSYVIDESERTHEYEQGQAFEHEHDHEGEHEGEHIREPEHVADGIEKNPLQAIEDELVAAIKDVKPGQLDSENKVVLLVDQYLSAANTTSRHWRDYVERFLIGACLGDYYIPHAVRERVANFCGLGNAVVAEDRLRPWEKEFLTRFDESEMVEELLNNAASRRNRAEHAVVHDTSNAKVLMLRLDSTSVTRINRWMHWLDNTYGVDAGIVNEGFRHRWHKLRQVEPLTAPVLCLFAAVMMLSGLALEKFGLPLGHFFQLPVASMVPMVIGLAVLSWANFVLVQLARPVMRRYLSNARDALYARVPLPILMVEVVACVCLIWGWALYEVLPASVAGPWVTVWGLVMLLLGVFTRTWAWADNLAFTTIALRTLWYYLVVFVAHYMTGAANWAASIWLVVGLTVICAPPRALLCWFVYEKDGTRTGHVNIRYRDAEFPLNWVRWGMCAGIVMALLALAVVEGFLAHHHALGTGVVTAMLVTLLAVELIISGGVHDDHQSRHRMVAYSALLVFAWLATRLNLSEYSTTMVQVGLAILLLWCAFRHLSPKHDPV